MPTIDEALGEFTADALTCRMLRAIYAAVPYSPDFPHVASVDDAVRLLRPEASAADLARARDIAANAEDLQDLLWMARLLDAGDKGYAIATGVFSAIQLFRGKGSEALETDRQQRNDAVLKGLGLAYMVYKAYPGSLSEKANAFRESPTGKALAVYYGAVEVALPFADNAAVAGSSALDSLFAKDASAQASRLATMAQGHSVEGAQSMLSTLTGQLQRVVDHTKGYVKPIADAAAPYVPGVANASDKVAGVVANAADVMPVYRLLGARLAAEAAARRALFPTG